MVGKPSIILEVSRPTTTLLPDPADSYAYDASGRMISATVGGVTTTYAYAGDGRRLSAAVSGGATTQFVWDLNATLPVLALERDGSGATLRTYLYGVGLTPVSMVAGGDAYYFHADALGSATDLTDAAGTSMAWSEYSPFGAPRRAGADTGAPANPPGFTGAYEDPTGLLHLRARQYDPGIGRFLVTDPAGPMGSGLSALYVYASNNPALLTDPSGRFTVGLCGGANGVLGVFGIVGDLCLVVSSSFEASITVTGGGGGAIGEDVGVTAGVQVSTADHTSQLGGPFFAAGASGGLGGHGVSVVFRA